MGRRPVGTKTRMAVDSNDAARADGIRESTERSPPRGKAGALKQEQSIPGLQDGLHHGAQEEQISIKSNTSSYDGNDSAVDRSDHAGLVHYGSGSEDEGEGIAQGLVAADEGQKAGRASNGSNHDSWLGKPSAVNLVSDNHEDNNNSQSPSGWTQCMDGQTGSVYFWNTITGETAWELPQRGEAEKTSAATADATTLTSRTSSSSAEKESISTLRESNYPSIPQPDSTGEEIASDATSDTASESNEENKDAERLPRSSVPVVNASSLPSSTSAGTQVADAAEGNTAHARAGHFENDGQSLQLGEDKAATRIGEQAEVDSTPDQTNAFSQHLKPQVTVGREAETGGDSNKSSGTLPSATDVEEEEEGVDDLFAGIEAELLSDRAGTTNGDGDASASADDRNNPREFSAGTRDPLPSHDFSALRMISSKLEARAMEANVDLEKSISSMQSETEETLNQTGISGNWKLATELRAMLQARVLDWQDGEYQR